MTERSFPLRAVASLFVARQHLTQPRQQRLTEPRVLRFLNDCGGLQLDSINVVDRAHYLTLWSRFGPYDRRALDRMAYERRVLFEYWAHAACLIPTSHFPAWRRAMLDYSVRSRAWGSWLQKNGELVDSMAEELRARGPLGNVHFQGKKPPGAGGWWNWKPTTHALDYLWMSGRTLVKSRVHFQKRFDLAERVLPEAVELTPLERDDFLRWHARQSLRAMGAATAADLRMYLSFPRADSGGRKRMLAQMLSEGEIVEVRVNDEPSGSRKVPWYALASDLAALSRAAAQRGQASRGTTLLTPFDSLLWHRERAQRLFGFDYKIEVYTPGEHRVHGYYVLPIFHDGQLIGRLDAKNHRSEHLLSVNAVHFENWFERGAPPPIAAAPAIDRDEAILGVAQAIGSLAEFVGATSVRLERIQSRRLGAALKRALKSWPD